MITIVTCDSPTRLALEDLYPWPNNPRRITQGNRSRLRRSLILLGLYQPLLVWRESPRSPWYVVGGNQKAYLLRELVATGKYTLDQDTVPVTPQDCDRATAKKLVVVDNDSDGDWDPDALSKYKDTLTSLDNVTPVEIPVGDLDLDLSGFTIQEYDEVSGTPGPRNTNRFLEKVEGDEPPKVQTTKNLTIKLPVDEGTRAKGILTRSVHSPDQTLVQSMRYYLGRTSP